MYWLHKVHYIKDSPSLWITPRSITSTSTKHQVHCLFLHYASLLSCELGSQRYRYDIRWLANTPLQTRIFVGWNAEFSRCLETGSWRAGPRHQQDETHLTGVACRALKGPTCPFDVVFCLFLSPRRQLGLFLTADLGLSLFYHPTRTYTMFHSSTTDLLTDIPLYCGYVVCYVTLFLLLNK